MLETVNMLSCLFFYYLKLFYLIIIILKKLRSEYVESCNLKAEESLSIFFEKNPRFKKIHGFKKRVTIRKDKELNKNDILALDWFQAVNKIKFKKKQSYFNI